MGVRIIHTADWQLGKHFRYVPGDAGAFLREQRFSTVRRIGELAMEREADLVVVAGDVFDLSAVQDRTLRRLADALSQFELPWLLLPGNHDPALAQSAWSRFAELGVPEHVHLLVSPTPFPMPELDLVVLPAPLTARHTMEDLTEWFDTEGTDPALIRIGLAHGTVKNRLPEASEDRNPISDTRAQSAKLDYLALGDWHGALPIAPKTWYAGTPEQDRFRSQGAGNVLVVDLERPGADPRVETVSVGHYRWQELAAELHRIEDVHGLERLLSRLPEDPERYVVSLRLRGTLGLRDRNQLQEMLATWEARLHHLRVDEAELHARATDADVDDLGATGFLADALERLQTIARDLGHPDHRHADEAIQMLYSDHRRESQR